MTNDVMAMLAELAAEPWLMEPGRLHGLFAQLARAGPQIDAVAKIEIGTPELKLNISDGVAVIPISGILLKKVPGWLRFFGIDASSYGDIARLVMEAARSQQVESIRLEVDSPGGTVAGVLEAATAIKGARGSKPVAAHVQDLAASAAYWLASQAQSITADLNALVGSIGVYTVYYDASKMAASEGIEVVVIASGEHKATGVFGAPITESQRAALHDFIEGIAENFRAAVAEGRTLSAEEIAAVSTGRLWEAKAALRLKLIDAVGPAPARPGRTGKTSQAQGDIGMANENAAETALATERLKSEAHQAGQEAERQRLAEFKAAFPGDLEYALAAYETGMSLEQAKAAHGVLSKRVKSQTPGAGADGRIGAQAAEGNEEAAPEKDFMAVSRKYAAAHQCSLTVAMLAVRAAQPELHVQFLQDAETRARPLRGATERVKV